MGAAMTYRQFMWGLSQGVAILGTAGGFWFTLGVLKGTSPAAHEPQFMMWPFLLGGMSVVAIVAGAVGLRRRATGFNLRELRQSRAREKGKAMMRSFLFVNAGQWALDVFLVTICVRNRRFDLIWPLIGLVMGLHFIPLAKAFRVRTYYFMGSAVIAVSALSLALEGNSRMLVLGVGIGLCFWLSAFHVLWNAEEMAITASGLTQHAAVGTGDV